MYEIVRTITTNISQETLSFLVYTLFLLLILMIVSNIVTSKRNQEILENLKHIKKRLAIVQFFVTRKQQIKDSPDLFDDVLQKEEINNIEKIISEMTDE